MPLRELRQALALAVGNRTGLLDALLGMFEQPGLVEKGVTPEELAAVTGNRHPLGACREWLCCLASGRVLSTGPGGTFALPHSHAKVLREAGCAAQFEGLGLLALLAEDYSESVDTGTYRRSRVADSLHASIKGKYVDNVIAPAVVYQIAPLLPGALALDQRGKVVEFECGHGELIMQFAKKYPKSEFVGVDRDAAAIGRAEARARERGLGNLTFRHVLAWAGCEETDADLALCIWAEYDSTTPKELLRTMYRTLGEGGALICRGMETSSLLENNMLHPDAAYLYAAAHLWSSPQNSRAAPSAPEAARGGNKKMKKKNAPVVPTWGKEAAMAAFQTAGFEEVQVHSIHCDGAIKGNVFFTATKNPSLNVPLADSVEIEVAGEERKTLSRHSWSPVNFLRRLSIGGGPRPDVIPRDLPSRGSPAAAAAAAGDGGGPMGAASPIDENGPVANGHLP